MRLAFRAKSHNRGIDFFFSSREEKKIARILLDEVSGRQEKRAAVIAINLGRASLCLQIRRIYRDSPQEVDPSKNLGEEKSSERGEADETGLNLSKPHLREK